MKYSQTAEEKKDIYSFRADKTGFRLDVFLSSIDDLKLSRAQVKKAADSGRILLNGLSAKAGRILKEGDEIVFERIPPVASDVTPEDIPLSIVYEDDSLLVVDKKAGMVVHPAAGNYQGTLVNALLHHCKDLSGIGGVMRPGIVHRLDKGTSGLMVVAKTDAAHRGLALQFKRHDVKKVYYALVYGDIKGDEGVIDKPVGRDAGDRKKMSTRTRRGKEARTSWRVCERYGWASLLSVDIETGRTHQIRVHLTHLGYPLVGDPVYGSAGRLKNVTDPVLKAKLKTMTRPALHASSLGFHHPVTGEYLNFFSPLPEDMAGLCEFLQKTTGPRSRQRGSKV